MLHSASLPFNNISGTYAVSRVALEPHLPHFALSLTLRESFPSAAAKTLRHSSLPRTKNVCNNANHNHAHLTNEVPGSVHGKQSSYLSVLILNYLLVLS